MQILPHRFICGLDPDFNLEEAEEQEEQCNRKHYFQSLLAEQLLGPTAEHTADKTADNNGYHQPQIRQIAVHQVTGEGPHAAEARSNK